jgi:hypothetical protein
VKLDELCEGSLGSGRHRTMNHPEIRLNPELREWFCVRSGMTSNRTTKSDAQIELRGFECNLPSRGSADCDVVVDAKIVPQFPKYLLTAIV